MIVRVCKAVTYLSFALAFIIGCALVGASSDRQPSLMAPREWHPFALPPCEDDFHPPPQRSDCTPIPC